MFSMLSMMKLISCNTFIIILSGTLQKFQNGSHYRCLSITLFLQHLVLHFDHANIDEKAALHPWTADLALGQFVYKDSLSRCGVGVSTRLKGTQRCWPCYILACLWDTKCVLERHFKPEPFQGRDLHICCLCCAMWIAHSVSAAGELWGSSSNGLFMCHQDDPCSPSHLPCHVLLINEETNPAQHLLRVPLKYWNAYQQAVRRCCARLTMGWWKILLSLNRNVQDTTQNKGFVSTLT